VSYMLKWRKEKEKREEKWVVLRLQLDRSYTSSKKILGEKKVGQVLTIDEVCPSSQLYYWWAHTYS